MAGAPKKRGMAETIKARATAAGFKSGLDYICSELEGGKLVYELAEELGCSSNMLRQWAYLQHDGKARWRDAQTEGTHELVDQGVKLVRDLGKKDIDKVDVARAKLELDQLNFIARTRNKAVYGNDAPQVNVQLNVGDLHHEALIQRRVNVHQQSALEAGAADYQVLPAGE